MAQPAGGQAVAVHHRTDAEQTTLGRAVADVVVEGELLRDCREGLLFAGTVIECGLHAAVDLSLEVALIPLIASGAEQLDWSGRCAVPHGSRHNEGGEEHSSDGAGEHRLDIAHAEGLVEALRRTGGDVEDAGNDADNACSDVVSHDAAGVEGVEALRPPGGLDRL